MTSQKHAEIIMALEPLNTLFGQMGTDKQNIYAEKLMEYDLQVIRKAVSGVQDKFEPTVKVPFPAVATLIKACINILDAQAKAHWRVEGESQWETQRIARSDLVSKYMQQYRTSEIMRAARAEGYDGKLDRYAREVAYVQAQLIIPNGNGLIGIESHVIAIDGLPQDDVPGWQREFIREMRRLLDFNANQISVNVPAEKIQQWKDERQKLADRQQVKA